MADLMYRVYTAINIQQQGNGRNLSLNFDFVNTYECEENWTSLTNTGKLILPKNIYAVDAYTKQPFPVAGADNNLQWITNLFRRGDIVNISRGYYCYDSQTGNERLEQSQVFAGYISGVESKQPIVLDIEDNMWLLKQMPCTPQVWPKTKTVEDLMNSLLAGTNYTVNATTQTTVGDLVIQDESVAQLLARLRKDFHLESYFVGNELRIGSLVYIPKDPQPTEVFAFIFQENIISDELTFQRKDDVKLSAVVESINTKLTGKTNKAGQAKTKQERLQVLVYSNPNTNVTGSFSYVVKQKNVDFPANVEGERRHLFIPNETDAATLAQRGAEELNKYYYTGFKGNFTTFGIPDLKIGDWIKLQDNILPDRTGFYVVKGVKKTGGIGGNRQVVTLDYKLTITDKVVQPLAKPVLAPL